MSVDQQLAGSRDPHDRLSVVAHRGKFDDPLVVQSEHTRVRDAVPQVKGALNLPARPGEHDPVGGESVAFQIRIGVSLITPSLPELLAVVLAVGLPIWFGFWWLSLDGDPGRHIRVGETILRHGLFYADPFSFTKAAAPFVPYEWSSEVLFALSNRAAGLAGVVVLAGAVIGLTYAVVARTLLQRGVGIGLAALTVLFAMAMGTVHWMARPHVFTLLGAALLMALVDRAYNASGLSRRALWSVTWPTALLFAAWANLHGGFLYGLFALAAVVVGERLEVLAAIGADRERWRGALVRHATMLSVAVIASLATPSGIGLYAHTLGYLRDTYLIDHTQEYLSPNFHVVPFALMAIVGSVAVLMALPRRPRYPTIALAAMTLAFSLDAGRNLPFWGIVVLPLVAAELSPVLGAALAKWNPPITARWSRLWVVWPALALAGMLAIARGGTPRLPATFNPSNFPVGAVRVARDARLTGRLYSEFTWGGYILYAWPEQRVFIDGQTDFYGDSIMRDYRTIHAVEPGWRDRLARWRIDLALVETNSPLADALTRDSGWRAVHRDSTATTFVHTRPW